MFGRDLAELVRHAGAAGDAGDEPAGAFQHALQHALRAAHFPQHVDVDRTLAAGDVPGALHLLDRALDGVGDQFLMPFTASERVIHLRDDAAFGIVAVGIDRADRTDTAGCCPGTRGCVIGCRNTFAALHERPNFAAVVDDGLEPLEHGSSHGFPITSWMKNKAP